MPTWINSEVPASKKCWRPFTNIRCRHIYNSISSQTGYFISKDLTFVMYQQRVSKYVLLCHCVFCRIVDLAGAILQQSWCAPLPSVHVKRAKHVRFYMHDLCALFRTLLGYILLVWHNCTSQRVFFCIMDEACLVEAFMA